ncbi:hypothetical protein [Streptomyces sp. CAS3]
MVDVAVAAVDTGAVVYVMRGAFKRRHRLAEVRHHAYVLRGGPCPAGHRMMTPTLRALYSRHTEDQANGYRALRAVAPDRLRSSLMS